MSWFRKKGLFLGAEERRLQKELQKPLVLSNRVTDKKNEVFEMIRTGKVQQEKNERAARDKRVIEKKALLRWSLGFVCAAVVFLGMGFYLNMTNSVQAMDLPIIGGIFKNIEEKINSWQDGEVSDHAVPLTESKNEENVYTKADNGITIMISEVYANPQNIYLSLKIKSEMPLTEIGYWENESAKIMQIQCDYTYTCSFMDEEYATKKTQSASGILSGVLLNEYTYEGALSLDFAGVRERYEQYMTTLSDGKGKIPDSFVVDLKINRIAGKKAKPEEWRGGYTEEEYWALTQEERDLIQAEIPKEYTQYPNAYHDVWFDGKWEFEIPVTIDESEVVHLDIDEINEEGYGLKVVDKTPQLITIQYVEPQIKRDVGVKIYVLDAEGYTLPARTLKGNGEEGSYEETFAVEGYDVSRVDVYIMGERFYNEVYATERWSSGWERGGEKVHFGEAVRAMLDEYNVYHKTLCLDSTEIKED